MTGAGAVAPSAAPDAEERRRFLDDVDESVLHGRDDH